MRLASIAKTILCCGVLTAGLPVHGKQWAMVVGIDRYPFQPLAGAVNDATLLADILRAHGVDLPDQRVLLDEKATVANFKQTWGQLVGEARPGDQIILTFAGHGAQEEEFGAPYDEKDLVPGQAYGKDETLIFYDFDPDNPHKGRLSDDELYALFEQAKALSILFVADSCHSGGITRAAPSFSSLPKRGGLDTFKPNPPDSERLVPAADDSQILEHVTYLAATDNEALEIPEITAPDQKPHGALSWSFVKAFSGAADLNGDHLVTRRELDTYLKEQVPRLTSSRQTPGLISRGLAADKPAFVVTDGIEPNLAIPPRETELAVQISGGRLPPGITGVRLVTPTPMEAAASLCRAAAAAGYAEGALCLGDLFNPREPKLPGGDWKSAAKYYHQASTEGNGEAGARLEELKRFAEAKAERGNQQAQDLLAHWPE